MPFIKIIFFYDNLLAAIFKMANLTMSWQYFSLGTVISEIFAKFPIRNSTHEVPMGFSFPE